MDVMLLPIVMSSEICVGYNLSDTGRQIKKEEDTCGKYLLLIYNGQLLFSALLFILSRTTFAAFAARRPFGIAFRFFQEDAA